MKVVHCLQDMRADIAQRLVVEYCDFIDKDEFDVTIICASSGGSYYDKYLKEKGIKVIYLDDIFESAARKSKPFNEIIKKFVCPFIFESILEQEKPNIIHSHMYMNRLVYGASKVISAQYYYSVHITPEQLWYGNYTAVKERKATKKLIEDKKMKLIVSNNDVRIKVNDIFNIKSAGIMRNCVDVSAIQNSKSKYILREENNVWSNDKVIMHIGRFDKTDNYDFLLKFFDEMVQRDDSFKLWLVGDGKLRRKLENKICRLHIEDRVVFWGDASAPEELIKMADLMIYPSYTEDVNLSLLEAQVAKVPCIISDTINRETVISNIVASESLDSGEAKWAEAAIELINRKEEVVYDNLDDWDIKNVVKELEAIYRHNFYAKLRK